MLTINNVPNARKFELSPNSSANAASAAPTVSKRYTFISTRELIQVGESQGFRVDSIQYPTRGKAGTHGAHLVKFSLPGDSRQTDIRPQICLYNSHDGSSTIRIMAGIFRLVCANGLIAGTAFLNERLRHVGLNQEDIAERLRIAASNTARLYDAAERFKSKELTLNQVESFAQAALMLRASLSGLSDSETRAFLQQGSAKVLETRRHDDKGNSLWNVYNRVQENLTKGNKFIFPSDDGRYHRLNGVKAIDSSLKLNQGLWEIAESMAA